jgi:hypothetical protein
MSAENSRRNLLGRLAALGIASPVVVHAAPEERVYRLTEAEMDLIETAVVALARTHEMNRIYIEACTQFVRGDRAGGCRTLAQLQGVIGSAAA